MLQEGIRNPFVYPEYQVFSPAYNQILPAFGLPRSMDGIVCRDEAVAKVQNTVFSNTLQGAVYIKSQGLWTGLDHRRILFNLF